MNMNRPVYCYTASGHIWFNVSAGGSMANEQTDLDLGNLVGLWEIVELPEEGLVFDLNQIDAAGIGKFGDAAEDMTDTLDLRAAKLPLGSYVAIFFPQTETPTDG